jgi:transposase
MSFIEGVGRDQQTLFPEVLDDYIPSDHPVRFIDAYVDQLDLERLGFERATAADTGRPGYHPGDLLKLYVYGYLNGICSSRKLEEVGPPIQRLRRMAARSRAPWTKLMIWTSFPRIR